MLEVRGAAMNWALEAGWGVAIIWELAWVNWPTAGMPAGALTDTRLVAGRIPAGEFMEENPCIT
jgi:hypothetical protein